MNITFTIADAVAPSVIDNVCAATNWKVESGRTKAQWARDQIILHVKRLNAAGAAITARNAQAATEAQIT